MEISTIIGLLLGVVAMVGVLMVGESEFSLLQLLDLPALIMVVGGAISVALVAFPMKELAHLFSILKKPFFAKPSNQVAIVDELIELAATAKRDGLLALEPKVPDIRDPFTALGIQLLADGTSREVVEEIMNDEIEALATRHREAKKIIDLIGRCGPAFGMIATLLGLILMLDKLKNPDTLGPAMAIALMGTLYGVMLSYLICIPLGEKLRYLSEQEIFTRQIALRGVLAIQEGNTPRLVQQKLSTSLPPRLRRHITIHSGVNPAESIQPAHFLSRSKRGSSTRRES